MYRFGVYIIVTTKEMHKTSRGELTMKNTKKNARITKILGTALAAAMMITMTVPIAASAKDAAPSYNTAAVEEYEPSSVSSYSPYYEERVQQYNDLLNTTKRVYIENLGGYHAKDVKLYGRKIIKVDKNANFILGDWELLYTKASFHGSDIVSYPSFEINGAYVAFAFSFDVTWGTDYPFSRVFWDDIYNTSWKYIDISMRGTCRMVEVEIKLGKETVAHEENCSSHKEWTP